jgi:radical SAM protein with 4Fe4S-binding SPASM domain
MNNISLLEYAINTNPTRVELELTERCNLSCKFCYNSQKPIDSSSVDVILRRLETECVPEIVLTGGEPVLHPHFSDIVHSCSTIFQKTMVQTNGTLVNETIASLLAEYNIYEVNVSLHGSPDLHDALTLQKGSYESAVTALKLLIHHGIRVSSNFVMAKENISGLTENLTELYKIGVRCMTLTRFTPTGIGSSNAEMALTREEIVEAIKVADDFSRANSDVSILLANSMPFCSLSSSLSNYCEHCHFGASRFYIDVNGNVLMCGMSRIKLGNIIQNPFADIKRSSQEFARHILGEDVPAYCSICANFRRCRGGCRAAALANTGDLCGADPCLV